MADENGRPLTYYPAFCHKASPTYFAWVKMGAVDVHLLKRGRAVDGGQQTLYFYHNHPIQFVCLAGIIVSRDEQARRTILVLDDSTGATIEVVCSKPLLQDSVAPANARTAPFAAAVTTGVLKTEATVANPETAATAPPPSHLTSTTQTALDITPLQPGTLAKVKGTLTSFRGMTQVHLERYTLLPDTNAEVAFWEERTRWLVDILSEPWVLEPGEVEMLRRECIREEEGKRARKVRREEERERRVMRKVEKEERDRVRIQRRYEREEIVRERMAELCREKSRGVMRKRG